MANRHKMQCRASGGRTAYSGGSSKVAKEAESDSNYASGGTVYSGSGSNVAKEAMEKKGGGKVEGKRGVARKARGGGTSSTSSPFTSAGGGGASTHPFSSAHRK